MFIKIEEEFSDLFKDNLFKFYYVLILFGCYICKVKNFLCDVCFLKEFCVFKVSFKV